MHAHTDSGLPMAVYAERRRQLMARLGKGVAVLLHSAPAAVRNADAEYPYRQHSDFHYLTGLDEPDALALLLPGRSAGEFILFLKPSDPVMAVWVGESAGLEKALTLYGASESYAFDEADECLPGLVEGCHTLCYPLAVDSRTDATVARLLAALRARVRQGVVAPWQSRHLPHDLHELRLVKSEDEIALMRAAAAISAEAHCAAMRMCRPGLFEYQVEAALQGVCAEHGVRAMAYTSIVAGGANACVLHYIRNHDRLQDGDLLLIDAGAEWYCYAADITRTFPVNGRFSESQKALYQWVLDAQLAAIDTVKPGVRWNRPHDVAVDVLTQGMVSLGLLRGRVSRLVKEGAYRRFYMHRTGHWLGMDVHDVGDYRVNGRWRTLKPGMVLTVEPGLYVPADADDVEACWRGTGIRIEDDVLVTGEGHEVLTSAVPKTVEAIEALMSEGRRTHGS